MAKPRDNRQKDLLRPALEAIIDLGHPLVRLAREIDWTFLDGRFAIVCTPREMRRRAAVEPVIGHAKAEHRMGRNYLKGRDGDRVLAGAGYNFGLLLRWMARLLRALFQAAFTSVADAQPA